MQVEFIARKPEVYISGIGKDQRCCQITVDARLAKSEGIAAGDRLLTDIQDYNSGASLFRQYGYVMACNKSLHIVLDHRDCKRYGLHPGMNVAVEYYRLV